MGSDGNGGHDYDLRSIEDVFACLEIISIARGALFGVDPGLARRMEKVSDALGAFSQLVLEGGLADMEDAGNEESAAQAGPVEESPVDEVPESIFTDLTINLKTTPAVQGAKYTTPADRKKTGAGDEEDGIIDILTGERIK
ncbi:MAG: hypothetical protein KKC76_15810 [Proteobacteria bacterium]|nr:hypothetical protein [Pseudomonadota bacterium]MBU4294575.1 hypothetical protein [Pseudomonadota bacterium]MCG2747111.1 hypothetical protein [Desulfobulbaceae bacterium]